MRLPERELDRIVRACAEIGVDGMRGDVVTARTARVLAALEGVDEVSAEHVRRAAHLALAHRRRRDPLGGGAADPGDIDRALEDGAPDGRRRTSRRRRRGGERRRRAARRERARPAAPRRARRRAPRREAPDLAAPAPRDRLDAPERAQALDLPPLLQRGDGAARGGRSARAHGPAAAPIDSRARRARTTTTSRSSRRCASAWRPATPPPAASNVRAGREGTLLCLVVDASGSMAARRRMARVKGALLGLLRDAYARRDRVAIVAFRDARAHVVHVPGAPLEHAAAAVLALRTGGRTPLAAGLDAATELIRRDRARDPRAPRGRRRPDRRPRARGGRRRRAARAAPPTPSTSSTPRRARSASASPRALALAAGASLIALPVDAAAQEPTQEDAA